MRPYLRPRVIPRDLETGTQRIIITHKGPRHAGPMRIRPETEATVTSYEDAVELLKALGYEAKLSFEKRRETWELGNCEVVLDELPESLGKFLEIEGKNEQSVHAVQSQLQLSDATSEPDGYAVLVARYLQQSGRKTIAFQ